MTVAGRLLCELGVAEPGYVDACIQSVHEHGPYIVLTKGVALAHARPEAGASGLGLVLVRLGSAIEFGHRANDPVDLVFALATPDGEAHVATLQKFARALAGGLADRLRSASGEELPVLLAQAIR